MKTGINANQYAGEHTAPGGEAAYFVDWREDGWHWARSSTLGSDREEWHGPFHNSEAANQAARQAIAA